MSIDQNHFALFGLPVRFALDGQALDDAYREVQGQVHPDRFAAADASARRVALQWATRANEAYQVLRDPLRRAQYLCEMRGIDLGIETNTAMSGEFLAEQMEWREALDAARDERSADALDALAARVAERRQKELDALGQLIDAGANHDSESVGATNGAADTHLRRAVRELMFVERFGEDVAAAHDALEN